MENKKFLLGLIFGAAVSAVLCAKGININSVLWWTIMIPVAAICGLAERAEL